MTLIANGISDGLPLEDAVEIANIFVASGRAIPPARWVADMIERARAKAREDLI